MNRTNWVRVRHDRRCPVCGRPDWCMVAADGSAAICSRIESDQPAGRNGAGWIHRLTDDRIIVQQETPRPRRPAMDWTGLSRALHAAMTAEGWTELSSVLGISISTLMAMQWGWCRRQGCWTVPMRDGDGGIIGIRTRHTDGSKRAITGSKSGLFYVPDGIRSDCLIVCEGPTDAAALLDAGFSGIAGRPSCGGGTDLISRLIRRIGSSAVLLIPDRDRPGLDGARRLADAIAADGTVPVHRITARVPPDGVKDCRDWKTKNPDDLAGTIGEAIRKLTTNMEGCTK